MSVACKPDYHRHTTQDAADGKALRLLREAAGEGSILDLTWVSYNQPGSWSAWGKHPKAVIGSFSGRGPTVAEAAVACREALVSR